MDGDERAPWKFDKTLQESLSRYVLQGLSRKEILDFVIRDFTQYTWSLHSLDRGLHHFGIFYNTDTDENIPEVMSAVEKELEALEGYWDMYHA